LKSLKCFQTTLNLSNNFQTLKTVMAEPKLHKKLTLLDSTTIIMGSMIGSGIFIVSADIARQVPSPGMLLLAGVVRGRSRIVGAGG
jgi:APA family basic amino acid/polyamine antiporter